MRLWKPLLIVAIVGSGFATGHFWKHHSSPQPQTPAPAVAVHQTPEVLPPGYDASLILPPPDTKGVMVDMPVDDIRKHFREKAGLKSEPVSIDGPMLPPFEPRPFTVGIPQPPTSVVPVEAQLDLPPIVETLEPKPLPPRVIRLPPPDEEPRTPARRVIHRQVGMWMYTNNREVSLNFDVLQKGPSGIKSVELWARRSSNVAYECVDQMEGEQPPFRTRLWTEGTYEFRVVFVSGTGVRTPTPKASEEPDIYVCLDTSPPIVEMQPTLAGAPGVITLRWKAEDKNIDNNSVTLSYSTDGDVWLPIAIGLPPEGGYSWEVPAGVPSEVHLRAEAKDKAGNVGVWRSSKTVPIDLTAPEGRISGYVERLPEPRVSIDRTKAVEGLIRLVNDFLEPPVRGITLPSGRYLEHLPQYLPAETVFPQPKELQFSDEPSKLQPSRLEGVDRELLPPPKEQSRESVRPRDSEAVNQAMAADDFPYEMRSKDIPIRYDPARKDQLAQPGIDQSKASEQLSLNIVLPPDVRDFPDVRELLPMPTKTETTGIEIRLHLLIMTRDGSVEFDNVLFQAGVFARLCWDVAESQPRRMLDGLLTALRERMNAQQVASTMEPLPMPRVASNR